MIPRGPRSVCLERRWFQRGQSFRGCRTGRAPSLWYVRQVRDGCGCHCHHGPWWWRHRCHTRVFEQLLRAKPHARKGLLAKVQMRVAQSLPRESPQPRGRVYEQAGSRSFAGFLAHPVGVTQRDATGEPHARGLRQQLTWALGRRGGGHIPVWHPGTEGTPGRPGSAASEMKGGRGGTWGRPAATGRVDGAGSWVRRRAGRGEALPLWRLLPFRGRQWSLPKVASCVVGYGGRGSRGEKRPYWGQRVPCPPPEMGRTVSQELRHAVEHSRSRV